MYLTKDCCDVIMSAINWLQYNFGSCWLQLHMCYRRRLWTMLSWAKDLHCQAGVKLSPLALVVLSSKCRRCFQENRSWFLLKSVCMHKHNLRFCSCMFLNSLKIWSSFFCSSYCCWYVNIIETIETHQEIMSQPIPTISTHFLNFHNFLASCCI